MRTILVAACLIAEASSFTSPASISSLSLMSGGASSSSSNIVRSSTITMGRKGRPKMPSGGMQGAYAQGAQGRAPEPPADGSTIFYLYCRSGAGKPWYPVSAMKG